MSAAPVLTILKDGEPIQSESLEKEIVIGRSEDCVIRLEDRAISRRHATFKSHGDRVQVERNSEFAPLMVNGSDCSKALLKEGDVVAIGPYLVKISKGKDAAPSADVETKSETMRMPADELAQQGFDAPLTMELVPAELEMPHAPEQPLTLSQQTSGTALLPDQPEVTPDGTEGPLESPLLSQNSAGAELITTTEEPQLQSSEGDLILGQVDIPGGAEEIAEPAQGFVDSSHEPTGLIDPEGNTQAGSAGKIVVRLLLPEGGANVAEFEMNQDEVVIGRGKECTIVLNDKKSSRRHSAIRRSGLNYLIRDLGSSNGTYVNGIKIGGEHQLMSDDRIQIGDIEINYKAQSASYLKREKDFMVLPSIGDLQTRSVESNSGAGAPDEIHEVNGTSPEVPVIGQAQFAGAENSHASPELGSSILGIPGGVQGGVAGGIPGVEQPSDPNKKQTLLRKYIDKLNAMPPTKRYIYLAVIILGMATLMFDEEQKAPVKTEKKPVAQASATPAGETRGTLNFESLSADQKKFVEAQHKLAFDYFKTKEFDKSLFEVRKIFPIITEYKDARELERWAEEGKRKLEAQEDEKKKKDEEEKVKVKVASLIEETRGLMAEKDYEEARDLFYQILALDPDNQQITEWKKTIEDYEENQKLLVQQKQVQEEINKRGWEMFREGVSQKRQGLLNTALSTLGRVKDLGASDPKLLKMTQGMIHACKTLIQDRRDPLLAEAKSAEESSDYPKAFGFYLKASKVDPSHPVAFEGMSRIRGVLHEKARVLYTEAVVADSYSDFDAARKKFQEVLVVAPPDDIYHERAQRKLGKYYRAEGSAQ